MRTDGAMDARNHKAFWIFLILCALAAFGCATFNPLPMDQVPFRDRAQRQCENNICVTAAVLSEEESEAVFGLPLYRKGIQPVWLEIENKSEERVWFLPVSVDPDYFAPLEVAYMHHRTFSKRTNDRMDQYLHGQAIRGLIAPGRVGSGFVFTNLDMGTKAFNVDLAGKEHRLRSFTFFISVPGLEVSHTGVKWESLYKKEEVVSYEDEREFRGALENLPCCTTNRHGTKPGRPLNLVIIGRGKYLHQNLIRRGWDETERFQTASGSEEQRSSTFAKAYRYAPVSPLYLYGRHQDAAFRKTRVTADERNDLRLWLSPIRYQGEPVWVGQVSRSIQVRYSPGTFSLEPLVDEARTYLLQDLWFSQRLEKFGYVKGVGVAPMSEPRGDLEGASYFTDGYRLVLWLSGRPVSFSDVEAVNWETPMGFQKERKHKP
jgi:hypothetical protein